eukprot:114286-Chlamydomonas_euryale.AAC.1
MASGKIVVAMVATMPPEWIRPPARQHPGHVSGVDGSCHVIVANLDVGRGHRHCHADAKQHQDDHGQGDLHPAGAHVVQQRHGVSTCGGVSMRASHAQPGMGAHQQTDQERPGNQDCRNGVYNSRVQANALRVSYAVNSGSMLAICRTQ